MWAGHVGGGSARKSISQRASPLAPDLQSRDRQRERETWRHLPRAFHESSTKVFAPSHERGAHATLLDCVAHVVHVRSNEQMVWTNAERGIAVVADELAAGDQTILDSVGNSVREMPFEHSVSSRHARSGPQPTRRGFPNQNVEPFDPWFHDPIRIGEIRLFC